MSVQAVLQAAVRAALAGHAALADQITGVFDAPPMRGLRPYALVEEPLLADWSTKDMAGREARVSVTLFDAGERPTRLRTLAVEVEAAIEAMPRDLGEGWQIASLVLVRARMLREGEGRWAAASDFRARMLRES